MMTSKCITCLMCAKISHVKFTVKRFLCLVILSMITVYNVEFTVIGWAHAIQQTAEAGFINDTRLSWNNNGLYWLLDVMLSVSWSNVHSLWVVYITNVVSVAVVKSLFGFGRIYALFIPSFKWSFLFPDHFPKCSMIIIILVIIKTYRSRRSKTKKAQ